MIEEIKQKININTRLAKSFCKNDLVVSYAELMFIILPKKDVLEEIKKYLNEEIAKLNNYYAKDEINEVIQIEFKKILSMLGVDTDE